MSSRLIEAGLRATAHRKAGASALGETVPCLWGRKTYAGARDKIGADIRPPGKNAPHVPRKFSDRPLHAIPKGSLVADTYATLKTNRGDITLKLFPNHAPETVRNFVGLATGEKEYQDPTTGEKKTGRFYDGLVFHRIIANFMLQGGEPLGTGTGGPGYTFEDEFHPELRFDKPYLLAMANAGPGTNGSQFFITLVPTDWLNRKHTIFGEVADDASKAVVDTIGKVATDGFDRPAQPVVIEKLTIARSEG